MRFVADENVSRLVIERLRNNSHDAMSIAETRSGAPDEDVLNAAGAEGSILITEDRDFGAIVDTPLEFAGLLSCGADRPIRSRADRDPALAAGDRVREDKRLRAGGCDANSEADHFVVADDDAARRIGFGGLHEAFG